MCNNMKIGIILNSNEPETIWNSFRFGVETLNKGHSTKIFLLGKGVEVENVKNQKFPYVKSVIKRFTKNKGIILACGTCLRMRKREGSKICAVSTMEEMLKIVEKSDKVLTFG